MGVLLTVVGVVVCVAITLATLPLLSRWLERSRSDSSAAQAFSAGFAPFEALFNPNRQDQLENLEHESQLYVDQKDGAPPHVKVDLDAGVAIVNDQPGQPSKLPYTGPAADRAGPETS